MTSHSLLFLLLLSGVCHSQTTEENNTTTPATVRQSRWTPRAIGCLVAIVLFSTLILSGLVITTVRGLREHSRLAALNESINSDTTDVSSRLSAPADWSEEDLAFIAKNWNLFSYDERIHFCQVFYFKMDQDTAPLFLQLFLEAFASELDRRVWYHLIDCFHLMYSMIFYNLELTKKLSDAVAVEAERILLNIGKDEMKGDNKDSSFLRFVCYDSLILLQNKKTIKYVLASFLSTKFEYSSALRLAVWTCTAREDKDPSDMRFILKERLQSEKMEEETRVDHEESGTRRQHLMFAIGSTTDKGIFDYMYQKFVTECQYTPSELVYLFKGACSFPDTRKRIMEIFRKDNKLKEKITKDKESHEQIISILSRTALVEKEIQELNTYVASTLQFGNDYQKKFSFDELHSRASRYNANSSVLHSNLIKLLDERKDKESLTPVVK